MGLSSALKAAVLGMRGMGERFKTHSQNIAATGVISAKKRVAFLSTINNSGSGSGSSFSAGGIQSHHQQYISEVGSQTPSPIPTHIALGANAFFVTRSTPDAAGRVGYTRVGTFEKDNNGDFVNHAGEYLQIFETDINGTPISADITTTANLTTLNVGSLAGLPTATANVGLNQKLPGTAPLAPASGSSVTVPVTIFDSLGASHVISFNWTKTAETTGTSQTWQVNVTGGADLNTVSPPYDTGIDVVFDGTGKITSIAGNATAGAGSPALNLSWNNAAANSVINLDIGAVGTTDGVVAVGDKYVPKPIQKDGMAPGEFDYLTFSKEGFITASFTNGETRIIGRVPVATFPAQNGLMEQTGNIYMPTAKSGDMVLLFPSESNAGDIIPGTVEASTIDHGDVFTDMIVDQRRYTANLRSIKTIDEMLNAVEKMLG